MCCVGHQGAKSGRPIPVHRCTSEIHRAAEAVGLRCGEQRHHSSERRTHDADMIGVDLRQASQEVAGGDHIVALAVET